MMIGRGRGRGRGKLALQPLRRPGQEAAIICDDEPLVDLPTSEERFAEVEGKEALPTGPTSSTICCQQFVHQGSLGLHQPLMPVVVHGLTAMGGLSQETPTTVQADVPRPSDERDPLEGLLYDPVSATGSVLGRGLESGVLVPKAPVVGVTPTGTISKRREEKKKEPKGALPKQSPQGDVDEASCVLGGEEYRVPPRSSRANSSGRTEHQRSPQGGGSPRIPQRVGHSLEATCPNHP